MNKNWVRFFYNENLSKKKQGDSASDLTTANSLKSNNFFFFKSKNFVLIISFVHGPYTLSQLCYLHIFAPRVTNTSIPLARVMQSRLSMACSWIQTCKKTKLKTVPKMTEMVKKGERMVTCFPAFTLPSISHFSAHFLSLARCLLFIFYATRQPETDFWVTSRRAKRIPRI